MSNSSMPSPEKTSQNTSGARQCLNEARELLKEYDLKQTKKTCENFRNYLIKNRNQLESYYNEAEKSIRDFDTARDALIEAKKNLEISEKNFDTAKKSAESSLRTLQNQHKTAHGFLEIAKAAQDLQESEFLGSFRLAPLFEDPRLPGEIEQRHANVLRFTPFFDPQIRMERHLSLEADIVSFFNNDSMTDRSNGFGLGHSSTSAGRWNSQKSTPLPLSIPDGKNSQSLQVKGEMPNWKITVQLKPYIKLTLHEDKIEAAWEDALTRDDIEIANSLLFSLLVFKMKGTFDGVECETIKDQACQFLTPGEIEIERIPSVQPKRRKTQPRLVVSKLKLVPHELMKDEKFTAQLAEKLMNEGEIEIEGFTGEANFVLPAQNEGAGDTVVGLPEVILTANPKDEVPSDWDNVSCRVSLIKNDLELVFFERKATTPTPGSHEEDRWNFLND